MSFNLARLLFLLLGFGASAAAQLPAFTSVTAADGTRPSAGNAMALDAAGNTYLAGSFGFQQTGGTIDFGTTNLTSAGDGDGFIAKLDPNGVCLWARRIGGVLQDDVYDIVVRSDGSVLVTGEFLGTTAIGPTNLVSVGGYDIFLAAFGAGGDLLWARRIGSAQDDYAVALAPGLNAETFFTGSFTGDIDLGGGNIFPAVDENALLIKLNPAGAVVWAKTADGVGSQFGSDIKIDAQGNILWAGEFDSVLSFASTNLTSPGQNVFIAKYDGAGTFQWARKLGEGQAADLPRLAWGADGRILCAAVYFGSYAIGGQNLANGLDDVLLASFAPDGTRQWVTTFGGAELDACTELLLDPAGHCYLVGYFRGTMSIGATNVSSSGSSDIFVARCSNSGQIQWVRKAGGLGPDLALSGTIAGPADLRLTGSFSGNASFGDISVSSTDGLPKVFWAKMITAPELHVVPDANRILVSWSTNLTSFRLESAVDLSSSWSEVTDPRGIANREFVVTNLTSNPAQFFRLRSND